MLPTLCSVAAHPQLLCWLMCDNVHIDPATGKQYILGTFHNIRVRQFPAKHPRMVWFLMLTDCPMGRHQLKITMGLPMEDMRTVVKRPFESRSPLDRIYIVNEIKQLVLDAPGNYSITIEVDDYPIAVTNLMVSGVQPPPGAPPPSGPPPSDMV